MKKIFEFVDRFTIRNQDFRNSPSNGSSCALQFGDLSLISLRFWFWRRIQQVITRGGAPVVQNPPKAGHDLLTKACRQSTLPALRSEKLSWRPRKQRHRTSRPVMTPNPFLSAVRLLTAMLPSSPHFAVPRLPKNPPNLARSNPRHHTETSVHTRMYRTIGYCQCVGSTPIDSLTRFSWVTRAKAGVIG